MPIFRSTDSRRAMLIPRWQMLWWTAFVDLGSPLLEPQNEMFLKELGGAHRWNRGKKKLQNGCWIGPGLMFLIREIEVQQRYWLKRSLTRIKLTLTICEGGAALLVLLDKSFVQFCCILKIILALQEHLDCHTEGPYEYGKRFTECGEFRPSIQSMCGWSHTRTDV